MIIAGGKVAVAGRAVGSGVAVGNGVSVGAGVWDAVGDGGGVTVGGAVSCVDVGDGWTATGCSLSLHAKPYQASPIPTTTRSTHPTTSHTLMPDPD